MFNNLDIIELINLYNILSNVDDKDDVKTEIERREQYGLQISTQDA